MAGRLDRRRVERALTTLEPTRRAVLLLAAREGLSNPEIAGRLGLTLGEVERHVAAALAELHRHLARPDRPWWRGRRR